MVTLAKNKWIWIGAGMILLLFYFIFDPVNSPWMPQCIFHRLTGLQCMGCGSQRLVHSLLHGDFQGAMQANTLLFFSIPFLLFLGWLEISRKRHPVLYRRVHSVKVIIAVSATLVAWLILRNYLGI